MSITPPRADGLAAGQRAPRKRQAAVSELA